MAAKGKFEFNLALTEGDVYILQIGKAVSAPGAISLFYVEPGVLNIQSKGPLLTGSEYSGSQAAKDQNDLEKYIKSAKPLPGFHHGDFLPGLHRLVRSTGSEGLI